MPLHRVPKGGFISCVINHNYCNITIIYIMIYIIMIYTSHVYHDMCRGDIQSMMKTSGDKHSKAEGRAHRIRNMACSKIMYIIIIS
jgi:hypothetical protein